jgi:hypothetical protein
VKTQYNLYNENDSYLLLLIDHLETHIPEQVVYKMNKAPVQDIHLVDRTSLRWHAALLRSAESIRKQSAFQLVQTHNLTCPSEHSTRH